MSIPLALQNFLPNWIRTIIGLMPFSPASRRYLYMKFLEADRRAATHVLGVPTGFFEHIRGWVARTHARFRAPAFSSLGARGRELRTKGLEVLGPVVPKSILMPVMARFQERLASDSAVRVVKEGTTLYEGGISFGAEDLPIISPVMVPEIVDALREATGGGFRVVSYFAWRIHHLPSSNEQETYAERWHSDGLRTDAYKVFVFLSEVTRKMAGLLLLIALRHEPPAVPATGRAITMGVQPLYWPPSIGRAACAGLPARCTSSIRVCVCIGPECQRPVVIGTSFRSKPSLRRPSI